MGKRMGATGKRQSNLQAKRKGKGKGGGGVGCIPKGNKITRVVIEKKNERVGTKRHHDDKTKKVGSRSRYSQPPKGACAC